MLVAVMLIKKDSPGPAIFKQTRVGEGKKEFTLYKFRSMVQNAETNGAMWAQKNDPRVTQLGHWLRTTRIDELPQLINVLKGDMSLVGPRPERPEFVHDLEQVIPYYYIRHTVKPGITGWAQIMYPYGSTQEDALNKLEYELFYIKNMSLLLDVKILCRTIGVMVFGEGAR
jgi:lipopolysaccharide/colanic/teichoic acid biosynthesis glycosyltransferase